MTRGGVNPTYENCRTRASPRKPDTLVHIKMGITDPAARKIQTGTPRKHLSLAARIVPPRRKIDAHCEAAPPRSIRSNPTKMSQVQINICSLTVSPHARVIGRGTGPAVPRRRCSRTERPIAKRQQPTTETSTIRRAIALPVIKLTKKIAAMRPRTTPSGTATARSQAIFSPSPCALET